MLNDQSEKQNLQNNIIEEFKENIPENLKEYIPEYIFTYGTIFFYNNPKTKNKELKIQLPLTELFLNFLKKEFNFKKNPSPDEMRGILNQDLKKFFEKISTNNTNLLTSTEK
jgi:hypothetical protein